MRASCSGVKSATWVTVYAGAARPSPANAWSRMLSRSPVRLRVLATVKSQARYRSEVRTPARASRCSTGRSARCRSASGSPAGSVAPAARVKAAGAGIGAPAASRRFRNATTYRCPSARFRAGRTSSAWRAGSVALLSSSAKYGHRSPVTVSRMTIGASRRSDRPMSVIGATPDRARSTPGTWRTSDDPGENPSARSQGPGCVGTPAVETGSISAVNASRRPVGDDGSARVYQSLGKGSRHSVARGSHPRDVAPVPPVAVATGGSTAARRVVRRAARAGRRRRNVGSPVRDGGRGGTGRDGSGRVGWSVVRAARR
jgi:hypothetical protein